MIERADRTHQFTGGIPVEQLQADKLRAESLLWNFTVLGEAALSSPMRLIQVPCHLAQRDVARYRLAWRRGTRSKLG
jgi:uncharacterized protein with HEPN domain